MSVTATKSEDFELVSLDTQDVLRVVDNVLYAYAHYTLTTRRKHVGVTAFTSERGSYTNSIQAYTGPTETITVSGGTILARWRCTRDMLGPADQVTGECWQELVWETYTEPEEVSWDEFEDVGGGE